MIQVKPVTLGLIAASRDFFDKAVGRRGRQDTIDTLVAAGARVVVPGPELISNGCVESLEDARRAGRLFRERNVDGVVVNAVNFAGEKAVAQAIRESGLNVPVLIVGCQEVEVLTRRTPRRDSFCGLLSIGEALRQSNILYTVAEVPICNPKSDSLREAAERFISVCRVVNGIRGARYGQVGARPDAFWTCRYNEKALQALGVTVVTLDLSEAIAAVQAHRTDADVKRVMADMKRTINCSAVNDSILAKIAKFELFLNRFVAAEKLDALAIQCWTSIQANLGICSCTTMSRFDDRGIPSACESDIMGTLSMHALQLASGEPSCLADWNNLHNNDPELVNCWHCGVFPTSWAKGKPKMGCQEIIAGTTGRDNAMGVVEFVMKNGPVTLCRATQDNGGAFKAVLVQGRVKPNKARTFGAYGWVRIPGLPRLYKNVLLRHFPHHVAMSRSTVGNILWEAFGNYLGFQVFTAENTTGLWTPDLPFRQ